MQKASVRTVRKQEPTKTRYLVDVLKKRNNFIAYPTEHP